MMKKVCAGILVAALAVAQPMTSIAAQSIGNGIMGGTIGGDSKDYNGNYIITGDGNVTTSSGEIISSDRLNLSIVDGPGGRLDITKELNEQFQAINSGKVPLNEIIKDVDLTGYNALVATNFLDMTDAQTDQKVKATVKMDLYVPNLIEGLGSVQILFCDHATGKWILITPTALNFEKKNITVELPSAGTFCVVYKK